MARVVTLYPDRCSCSRQIGAYQMDIEAAVISEIRNPQPNPNIEQSPLARVLDRFGFDKMCCRSSIMNSPLYFVRSTDIDRFLNETGETVKTEGEDFPTTTPLIDVVVPPFPILPGEPSVRVFSFPSVPVVGFRILPLPTA